MSGSTILLALVPALTYPLICIAYYLVLRQKRADVLRLLKGDALRRYFTAYVDPVEVLSRYTAVPLYVIPVGLNILTVGVASSWTALEIHRAGFAALFTGEPAPPAAAIAGFLGAYLWGHYDLLHRLNRIDLSPSVFYYLWIRLVIGGAVGYAAGPVLGSPLDLLAAMSIGAFPLETIRRGLQATLGKYLTLAETEAPSEPPTLQLLQGATPDIVPRLAEEGIWSVQHLALADPVRLLMRTNIEWTVILDLIDQANLQVFVRDGVPSLSKLYLRGAISLGEAWEETRHEDPGVRTRATKLLEEVARSLGVELCVVENLAETIYEDPQVDFIWQLWLEAFPTMPRLEEARPVVNEQKSG